MQPDSRMYTVGAKLAYSVLTLCGARRPACRGQEAAETPAPQDYSGRRRNPATNRRRRGGILVGSAIFRRLAPRGNFLDGGTAPSRRRPSEAAGPRFGCRPDRSTRGSRRRLPSSAACRIGSLRRGRPALRAPTASGVPHRRPVLGRFRCAREAARRGTAPGEGPPGHPRTRTGPGRSAARR